MSTTQMRDERERLTHLVREAAPEYGGNLGPGPMEGRWDMSFPTLEAAVRFMAGTGAVAGFDGGYHDPLGGGPVVLVVDLWAWAGQPGRCCAECAD